MNMISTGAFQNEMDASNKQPNVAKKFAAVWEKKNAKAARAGGVSLMALSLAACGSDDSTTTATTATTTTTTTTTPAAPTNQAFTLTTASNVFTGGDGADTFAATNTTLNGNDELVGGTGVDTLTITHTGTTAFTAPAADISGIETIEVRNLTGTADAVNETATVTFQALSAGQTVTLADVTFTAGASGATAANVAAGFIAGTITATNAAVTGGVLTKSGGAATTADTRAEVVALQAAAGYVTTAGSDTNTVTYTATGASFIASNLTDLQATGTAATGANYVKTVTVGTKTSGTKPITFEIDGNTVKTGTPASDNVTGDAAAVAAAINGYFGSTVATASAGVVTVTTPGNHSITNFGEFSIAAASQTIIAVTATTTTGHAAAAPSIVYVDGSAASTGKAGTYDMSKFTGATEFVSDRSTSTVNVTNMAAGQELTVKGNGALTNGDSTAAYGATVTSLELNIEDGMKAGDITITAAGATSATVNSSGDKNTVGTVDIGGGTLTTLTIDAATNLTGDLASQATDQMAAAGKLVVKGAAASVSLSAALDNTITVVDASAMTAGGLTATVGTGTTTITGGAGADAITLNTGVTTADMGAGDDTVTTAAVAATAAGAIKGGSGTDILSIAATTNADTTAEGAVYTGFETVETAVDQNVSLISGITAVNVNANTGISVTGMSAAAAGAITAKGTVSGDMTLTLGNSSGTADVVTINASFDDGNATTTNDATQNVSVEDINIQGIETLNINSTTGTAATDSVYDIDGSGAPVLTALNLTGSADVSFNSSGAITKAVTVVASNLGGALTFAGDLTTGSSVTSGAGADVITSTTSNGTAYVLGAGKDSFTAAIANLAATGANDTSVNAGDGIDTLTLSDAGSPTILDNHFTNASNFEKLTLSATGDTSITTGSAFASTFGSAVTLTAASLADAKSLTFNGGLYNGDATLTITSAGVGNATGENHVITTGDGADTVSLTIASWLGNAGNGSGITIATDQGNDTISVTGYNLAANTTTTFMSITGGTGADTITTTGDNGTGASAYVEYVIAAGDSLEASYDTLIGFEAGDSTNVSSHLNFAGTAAITDFTNSTDKGVIKSHSTATGIVKFDDATNYAAELIINSGNLGDVIDYLETNTDTNDAAVFAYDNNGDGTNESTMVFHNGTTDSVVFLQDVTGLDAMITTNGTGANDIFIV
jgi:hypothetical protein